jgi:hypothetical protein
MRAPVTPKNDNPAYCLVRGLSYKENTEPRSRIPDLCIKSVDIAHGYQSLEVTRPQPGCRGSRRLNDRTQLIRVAGQDDIGRRIRERHDWNHRKGFLRLCSLIDDNVTEMPDRYIQCLEDSRVGACRE